MKYLITLLLLLATLVTRGQLGQPTLDTTFVSVENNKIFVYSYREYEDGTRAGNFPNGAYRLPATDTAEVVNFFVAESINRSRQWAQNVVSAAQKGVVFRALNTYDNALTNFTGTGAKARIQAQLEESFIGEDWRFLEAGQQQVSVRVFKAGNGVLRLDFQNGTVRTIDLRSDVHFRVLNFPDGTATNFFKLDNGAFVAFDGDLGRKYTLGKVSMIQALRQ